MKATKAPAKATAPAPTTQAARIAALEASLVATKRTLVAVKGQATKDRGALTAAREVIDAQSIVMADQRRKHNALEGDVQKIKDLVWGKKPPAPTPPAPPPATPVPPTPPPTPTPPAHVPAPKPPSPIRTRADVIRIIVEEFGKQTPFLPGEGDVTDPNKAIGQWATLWINDKDALYLPEEILRTLLAVQVDADIRKYSWERKPGSEPPVVLIDGMAEIRAA